MRQPNQEFGGWFWTNLRIYTPWKAIAVLLVTVVGVVGCGREGAMSRSVEVSYGAGVARAAALTEGQWLQREAARLRELITVITQRGSTDDDVARIGNGIAGRVQRVLGQLSNDRERLRRANAQAALQRGARISASIAKDLADYRSALHDVTSAATPSAAEIGRLRGALDRLVPPPVQQPLSSKLGFRQGDAKPRPLSISSQIVPAYAAPIGGSGSGQLPVSPSADDLDETPETKRDSTIQSLADSLGHDPVRIYDYVRNRIEFEPYFGVRKGAAQTLAQRAGSDADQSALLIALLRASGTPARFVRGVSEVDPIQLRDMLGLNDVAADPGALADVLAGGGVPTTQVRANGELKKVRFDHIWVEAYVANAAYRGVDEGQPVKRWLPLDASVKGTATSRLLSEPLVTSSQAESLASALDSGFQPVGNDGDAVRIDMTAANAFMASLGPSLRNKLEVSSDLNDVHTAADADATTIRPVHTPVLPASLPIRAVAVTDEFRGVPASLTARVRIEVSGASATGMPSDPSEDDSSVLAAEFTTVETAAKRLSLTYSPAGAADSVAIDAYHGLLDAPAYAANLVPVIRLDGTAVRVGQGGVGTGYYQRLRITYVTPGFAPDVVDNPVSAGNLSVLTLDTGAKAWKELEDRYLGAAEVAGATTDQNAIGDARLGALLGIAGARYFLQNDIYNAQAEQLHGVYAVRAPSGVLTQMALETSVVGGFPLRIHASGVLMDADQDVQSVTSLMGAPTDVERYLSDSGAAASQAEGDSLRETFQQEGGVSTVAIIAKAISQGVALYNVTDANWLRVKSALSLNVGTLLEIERAVGRGARVLVPAESVTLDNWSGTGYVIEENGARDYRIAGGLSGGQLVFGDGDELAITSTASAGTTPPTTPEEDLSFSAFVKDVLTNIDHAKAKFRDILDSPAPCAALLILSRWAVGLAALINAATPFIQTAAALQSGASLTIAYIFAFGLLTLALATTWMIWALGKRCWNTEDSN